MLLRGRRMLLALCTFHHEFSQFLPLLWFLHTNHLLLIAFNFYSTVIMDEKSTTTTSTGRRTFGTMPK